METTSTSVEIERLERKVDMSLDDIIKMKKKMRCKKRKSIKKPKKKNAGQESAASHPAVIQQGRIAKTRRGKRDNNILAPRNAVQKVSFRMESTFLKKRNWKRSGKSSRASGDTSSNMKVLVPHDLRRLLSGTRKGGIAARLTPRSEEMESSGLQRNLQTLDSRFASLSRDRRVPTGLMHRPVRDGF